MLSGLLLLVQMALGNPVLAIADLQNHTGEERFDAAGPGASSMLITKLSRVSALTVVERGQIESVLKELKLNESDVIDPSQAVKAGRALGARFFVHGELVGVQGEVVAINLRVVDTETTEVVVTAQVLGNLATNPDAFFDMINTVSDRLIDGLALDVTAEERETVRTVRTNELEALMAYGTGGAEGGGTARDVVISAGALVELLKKPYADLRVCDASRVGRHVRANDRSVSVALLRAAKQQEIAPDRFRRCMAWVDKNTDDDDREKMWTKVLKAAVHDLDREAGVGLVEAVARRPAEAPLKERVVKRSRRAIARGSRSAPRLKQALDADAGRWDGSLVTSETLTTLDEYALDLLRLRLPDEELRDEAARTLVDLRIDQSAFSVVKSNRESVRSVVLEQGYWPVPGSTSVKTARFQSGEEDARMLRIVAAPYQSSATVITAHLDGSPAQESHAPLTGLRVQFHGFEKTVGLCSMEAELDPTPCVSREQLALEHPYASLVDGELAFSVFLPIDDVVKIGRAGDVLQLPLSVHDASVSGVNFPVAFDPVEPLRFWGPSAGADGPDLNVDVYEISHGRVLVGVRRAADGEHSWAAVVEQDDPEFRVASIGATGVRGRDGAEGQPGIPGQNGAPGTCEANGQDGTDGSDGGPGGPGENGGPGGNGGDVTVTLHCSSACRALEAWSRERFVSRAGSGGSGGFGGRGGDGGEPGQGGDGATCEIRNEDGSIRTKTTFSGHDGQRGDSGDNGPNGQPGPPGAPGQVTVKRQR